MVISRTTTSVFAHESRHSRRGQSKAVAPAGTATESASAASANGPVVGTRHSDDDCLGDRSRQSLVPAGEGDRDHDLAATRRSHPSSPLRPRSGRRSDLELKHPAHLYLRARSRAYSPLRRTCVYSTPCSTPGPATLAAGEERTGHGRHESGDQEESKESGDCVFHEHPCSFRSLTQVASKRKKPRGPILARAPERLPVGPSSWLPAASWSHRNLLFADVAQIFARHHANMSASGASLRMESVKTT